MNERIQELARQAGFYANPDVEKFEKFAELIVMDCASIVYNNADDEQGESLSRLLLETYGVE